MADKKLHIDELMKDALGEYAEKPPIGAWTNMEARLDDSEDVDIFFGDVLAGQEVTPPAEAWTKMEARLDEQSRGKRRAGWYWLAAGFVGLLLGSYLLLSDKKEHNAVTEQTEQVAPVANPPAEVNKPAGNIVPAQTPTITEVPKTETPTAEQPKSEEPRMELAQEKEEPTLKTESKKENPVVNAPQQVPETIAKQEENTVNPSIENRKEETLDQDLAQIPEQGKTDTVEDDIAQAMKNRETDVLMNIKRSAYSDSMEAAEKAQQEIAATTDSMAKQVQTPQVAKTADSARVPAETIAAGADTLIAAVAQKLEEKVKEKIEQSTKTIEPVQDAMVPASQMVQAPPDKLVFTETDAMKEKIAAMVDNGTDKGSLEAFIGPMEDSVSYNIELTANTATQEAGQTSTPFNADIYFKTGFERGFDKYSISKFVLAPSFEIKLADKLGLMLQPAIKVGSTNLKFSGPVTYHDVQSSIMDSNRVFRQGYSSATGIIVDSIQANYYFKEQYETVRLAHSLSKRSTLEIDMPLMLSYKVGRNVSIYGGPVATFSSTPKISTQLTRSEGGILRDTISYAMVNSKDVMAAPTVESHEFAYDTKDYKSYDAEKYANSTVNKLRMGAMAGMSVNMKDRLSVDLSLMQNLSGLRYIPNSGVRNLYLQPYVRFMLGYKLYGKRK